MKIDQRLAIYIRRNQIQNDQFEYSLRNHHKNCYFAESRNLFGTKRRRNLSFAEIHYLIHRN